MEGTDQILLVDNSNTRTKLMLSRRGELLPECRMCPTAQLSVQSLRRVLQGWRFSRILVSSVVPTAEAVFREAWPDRVRFLTPEWVRGVDFNYPGLATLGADRVANILAVSFLHPLPCVAVDLGTAATFDVVVDDGGRPQFIGGVIAPGLRAMTASLSHATAQLPALLPGEPERMIGRNTQEAMLAGTVGGYRSMVEGILHSLQQEVGRKLYTVATGGDAPFLGESGESEYIIDSLLTFKGLNLASSWME